ncbi:hypothetical protein JI435_420130 [Parastagonospora nodorum SN15]|uniref:Uncharacterized protein n=1 Tax=Phaeosphaeria nodorum (strain SN15 / ATCC MYA-4574 / FGSC 10173) TaxID=321614 RepID=A0A7U2FE94_PHANO|nr:hypothetical protein JI435_420130 [Parastagonospora nodorum SN15]
MLKEVRRESRFFQRQPRPHHVTSQKPTRYLVDHNARARRCRNCLWRR